MCLAAEKDGKFDVIANEGGDFITPTVYGLLDGEVLCGIAAKQLRGRKPESVAVNSKGRIGAIELNDFCIEDDGRTKKVSVEKVHTQFYKYMKNIAVGFASEDVAQNTTVITVPMDFTKKQREAVKKCAISAGFNVTQVISEVAAATLAYDISQENQDSPEQKCLIFQCGGATLTCSVVSVSGGMVSVINSLKKDIGGDQITEILIEMIAKEFIRKYKADPRETKRGKTKLKINAENAKHVLSSLDTANCYIESLHEGIDYNGNLSRSRFELEFSKTLPKLIEPIVEVLELSNLKPSDISKVILCGGSSKIPKLQSRIKSLFEDAEILNTINPDEVIAVGAAKQASLLPEDLDDKAELNENVGLRALNYDIVFTSEQVAESGDDAPIVLIPRNFPIPVRKSYHLPSGSDSISVKVFLRASNQEMNELIQLTLTELSTEAKPSISAHIHRDGGIHIALTEKASNKCDQLTLPAPVPAAAPTTTS